METREKEPNAQITEQLERIETKIDTVLDRLSTPSTQKEESEGKFLDITEVADRLRVSQKTIYNWVYNSKITYLKINGRLLFPEKEVELLYEEREWIKKNPPTINYKK